MLKLNGQVFDRQAMLNAMLEPELHGAFGVCRHCVFPVSFKGQYSAFQAIRFELERIVAAENGTGGIAQGSRE
jgi:hypothetical protein